MNESPEPEGSLVEVGRYRRLAAARERGLVVAALEMPYCVEREGNEWVLLVEEDDLEAVRKELEAFEFEEAHRRPVREIFPSEKIPTFSLYVAGLLLTTCFLLQRAAGESWVEAGAADSRAILRGEWWRTITALTLHADGAHLLANLATGLLFAAFVIPRLGAGLGWLAILFTGAVGNALNAWGYRGEEHLSIGASTACFGALGIIVGAQLAALWREPQQRSLWQLILPVGAGLALLAFLGVGDEGKTIDFMAHGWGLAVGVLEGGAATALRAKERCGARWQLAAGWLAVVSIALAWMLVFRG